MRQNILIALICGLTLTAGTAGAEQRAQLLAYKVYEQGIEPYFSRILVTPAYLRMDEGEGSQGFTLFDREQEIVYNVSHEDSSVLVIDSNTPLPARPDDLKLEEKWAIDPKAPAIAGKQPQNVRLYANGELCLEMVTVPGLMTEAVEALREFRLLLARVQAQTLAAMPDDTQSACDLAQFIYASGRVYDYGLPVRESGEQRGQELVDFSDGHPMDAKLFELPADYRRMGLPGAIGGEQ